MFLFINFRFRKKYVCFNSNTSYVLIYRDIYLYIPLSRLNSNTSYVLIYPAVSRECDRLRRHSNTSYVLIYPCMMFVFTPLKPIQIHLMFLFISFVVLALPSPRIQIHLMFLFICMHSP